MVIDGVRPRRWPPGAAYRLPDGWTWFDVREGRRRWGGLVPLAWEDGSVTWGVFGAEGERARGWGRRPSAAGRGSSSSASARRA